MDKLHPLKRHNRDDCGKWANTWKYNERSEKYTGKQQGMLKIERKLKAEKRNDEGSRALRETHTERAREGSDTNTHTKVKMHNNLRQVAKERERQNDLTKQDIFVLHKYKIYERSCKWREKSIFDYFVFFFIITLRLFVSVWLNITWH